MSSQNLEILTPLEAPNETKKEPISVGKGHPGKT